MSFPGLVRFNDIDCRISDRSDLFKNSVLMTQLILEFYSRNLKLASPTPLILRTRLKGVPVCKYSFEKDSAYDDSDRRLKVCIYSIL